MYRRIFAAAVVIGAIVVSVPAYAANCANRDRVVERLEARYKESLTAGGLQSKSSGQTLVEVFASEKNGTFTILLTTPEGLTCVVAAGTDWHQASKKDLIDGSAS